MKISMGYLSVSLSALKKDPAAVLREARNRPVAVVNHNRPVAVLNHNRLACCMVEPELSEAMVDALADQAICSNAVARLADRSRANGRRSRHLAGQPQRRPRALAAP